MWKVLQVALVVGVVGALAVAALKARQEVEKWTERKREIDELGDKLDAALGKDPPEG